LVGYGLEDPGSGQGLRPCPLRQDWAISMTSMTYSNDEQRCLWEGGKGLNVSTFMLPQMARRKGFHRVPYSEDALALISFMVVILELSTNIHISVNGACLQYARHYARTLCESWPVVSANKAGLCVTARRIGLQGASLTWQCESWLL
jgi:hypothetical protein